MNKMFTQPTGPVAKQVNKQASDSSDTSRMGVIKKH